MDQPVADTAALPPGVSPAEHEVAAPTPSPLPAPMPSALSAPRLAPLAAAHASWDEGATGEQRLTRRLDDLDASPVPLRVLHDRLVLGGRSNIDHVAVTPSGVHVIDTRRYRGRPRRRVDGGVLRPRTERLMIGSRDRTVLVDGMHEQLAVVRRALSDAVPVHGVLCFVDADWPALGGSFTLRGIAVARPGRLLRRLAHGGPLDEAAVDDVHRRLAAALAPA